MRPGVNLGNRASPVHIIHGSTFITGYDLSETQNTAPGTQNVLKLYNFVICGLQFVYVVVVPIYLENRHISSQYIYIVTRSVSLA